MIGVNADNLDVLIKKNNMYLSSLNNNLNKLTSSINDLNSCYSGSSLNYLFSEPINEIKNIRSISNVVASYSDTLYAVKVSYQQQDQNFATQLNHINSNLK